MLVCRICLSPLSSTIKANKFTAPPAPGNGGMGYKQKKLTWLPRSTSAVPAVVAFLEAPGASDSTLVSEPRAVSPGYARCVRKAAHAAQNILLTQ